MELLFFGTALFLTTAAVLVFKAKEPVLKFVKNSKK